MGELAKSSILGSEKSSKYLQGNNLGILRMFKANSLAEKPLYFN
jgi:hypothetical protein